MHLADYSVPLEITLSPGYSLKLIHAGGVLNSSKHDSIYTHIHMDIHTCVYASHIHIHTIYIHAFMKHA